MPEKLTQEQAADLVRASAKAGRTPPVHLLEAAFGQTVGSEIAAMLKRREAEAGRAIANGVLRRQGVTQHRTDAPTEVDVSAVIREMAPGFGNSEKSSIPQPASKSRNLKNGVSGYSKPTPNDADVQVLVDRITSNRRTHKPNPKPSSNVTGQAQNF
ncbi:hypothetical protein [Streptomyces sp. NRRL WC-3549]|uniref:hypothetical protein n=1 Tax=Streptomyces sp. NRRL WC-3549 TaxID=1463925 RepID=UPI00131B5EE7|nr:hypothetical protein [Streptomyces sp. NRRL WC-3549]